MFRCQKCNKQISKGIKPERIVTETRHKVYRDERGDYQGEGDEIVKEMVLGPCCALDMATAKA